MSQPPGLGSLRAGKENSFVDCDRIEKNEIAERYIAPGSVRLSAQEAADFEQHYFECALCFERLETMRAAQPALAAFAAVPIQPIRRGISVRLWLAAAAVLIAAAVTALTFYSPARKSSAEPPPIAVAPVQHPDFTVLARYEPPAYEDQSLRGAEPGSAAAFRGAMKLYSEHNYSAAAAALGRIANFPPARFFEAASELLSGDPDAAISHFSAVVRDKDPVFTEEAQWGLAKAWLQKGDVAQARPWLDEVIRGGGDFAARAHQLRDALDK
jgi:tetratricopeptide (TPR) repeat protein